MSTNVLTRVVLIDVSAHAFELYPEECCGFIFADGTVHRGTNIQNRLAAEQPGRYSRTAANGYTLSVEDTLRLNMSFDSVNPAVVLYHSHPNVGAYFSAEDKEKALFAEQPVHPIDYLVIDVQSDGAQKAKLFAWDGADFACIKTYEFKLAVVGV